MKIPSIVSRLKNSKKQRIKQTHSKAFTLVEILLVVAIIAILSAVVLVSIQGPQKAVRDSRRQSDISQISKSLQRYYLAKNTYPQSEEISIENESENQDFVQALKGESYVSIMPGDPLYSSSNGEYSYKYISTTSDSYTLCAKSESKEGYFCVSPENTGISLELEAPMFAGWGGGEVCNFYNADPSWVKVSDTIVRNINDDYNITINKDIYCDNFNCILWTDEAVAPASTICISSESNIYANILWSKTNSTISSWGPATLISGGDIGGSHPFGLKVGNNGINVGGKNWLEKDYASTAGTFAAMDICKAKGEGWRLPTILELDSIHDQAKGSSPYSRIPNISGSYSYWSSSEEQAIGAYGFAFYNGGVGACSKTGTGYCYTRCVRD